MKICYKILTHNETDSLEKLLDFLFENIKEQDHIIVCDDFSDSPTRKILAKYVIEDKERLQQYDYFQRKFEGETNDSIKIYNIVKKSIINQGLVFFGGFALSIYKNYMPQHHKKNICL